MNTKKTVTLMSLFCITIILAITGCKKDDDKNKLEESYFSVENGTFTNADIPEPSGSQSAPVISSVYGNPSILEGGSNPISLQTSSSFKDVIIGVEGVKGYYTIPEAGSGKSLKSNCFAHTVVQPDIGERFICNRYSFTRYTRINQCSQYHPGD